MKHHCHESRNLNSFGEFEHHVDNSRFTIQKLSTLYSEPELSDLKLYVGEHMFLTHKLILSISSDVFKTMLTSPTWPEAYQDQIHLQEETECQEVFGDFLHYLYSGKIRMSHVTVLPILSLADKYNISDLSQLCIDYMCCHYVAPKEQSRVISWYNYATMCGHRRLEHVCEEYILWNFQYVTETEDFLSASAEVLIHFLKSSDITIHSEHYLYQAVKKWVTKKSNTIEIQGSKPPTGSDQDMELEYILKQISHQIHFSLMTCSELEMLQEDSLVKEYSGFLETQVKAALALRKTQLSHHSESQSFLIRQHHVNSCFPKSNEGCDTSVKMSSQADSTSSSEQSSEGSDFEKTVLKTENRNCDDHSILENAEYTSQLQTVSENLENTATAKYQSSVSTVENSVGKFTKDSPRVYTCDSWCTEVMVEGLSTVPKGEVLGAFFSTPVTGLEEDDSNYWDWHLDLYPNSVNFKKCMMIGIFENNEIDEVEYETIRITVISNIREKRRVKVSVLVFGLQNGIEYVAKGITKTCFFDEENVLHNLNDVIPYSDVHCAESQFQVGSKKDTLKVKIVIRPISNLP